MQDILIYARDFKTQTPALDHGMRLAVESGAAVTGVYAYPSPLYDGLRYGRGAGSAVVVKALCEDTRDRVLEAERAGGTWLERAQSAGIRHAQWVVVVGDATDALVAASTHHDLVVLDRDPDTHADAWDLPGLILRSACPCFVLPRDAAAVRPVDRIAIGWNGSPEATRAVHAALPFVPGREVLLLRGEERDRYAALDWHPPFEVEAYLVRHGAKLTSRSLEATPDGVGAALLRSAAEFGASLLIMGAFGHTRFSEWLLGGATRDVLALARMPLLLRH